MSLQDFRGAAYAFKRLQELASQEIADGKAQGAKVVYAEADPRKVKISRWATTLLKWKRG